ATVGIVGAAIQLVSLFVEAAKRAAEAPPPGAPPGAAHGGPSIVLPAVLLGAALVGFVLARVRVRAGWWLAALAALALALGPAAKGQWARLVNPLHVLAGGLWLGTLAVLVAAFFPLLLRGDAVGSDPDLRPGGSRLDALVRRFSRLALASSALLAVTGVTTAWRHLGAIDALWTTPYGWALDVKLLIVASIAAFGYYNWRVATPGLSAGSGDARLARASLREVSLGVLVLIVTAVLVSLPAPAEEREHAQEAHDAHGAHAGPPGSPGAEGHDEAH
ncbi:MAG TPA: CopD family protein, partial [Gemmatirosa sp.]